MQRDEEIRRKLALHMGEIRKAVWYRHAPGDIITAIDAAEDALVDYCRINFKKVRLQAAQLPAAQAVQAAPQPGQAALAMRPAPAPAPLQDQFNNVAANAYQEVRMPSPQSRDPPPPAEGMEAVFFMEEDSYSTEELGEWFNLMIEHNARMMSSPEIPNYELGERITRQLFAVCNKMRIATEAKIDAAIVLNKYLNTLKIKASNLLLNESNVDTRRQLHDQVRTRMLRHMPLRIVSAIQIASKMFTYRYVCLAFLDSLNQNISTFQTPEVKHFKKHLHSIDQPCTSEELVASEMTVLDAIDFDVSNANSPVAFLETVFQMFVMTRAKGTDFNAQKYWKASLQVLELVFLSYDETMKLIIKSYLHINKDATRNLGRPSIQHLKCDYLLLSCGVLCVPVARLAGKEKLHEMAKELSMLTSLERDHIISAANGIFHMIRQVQGEDENTHFVASRLDQTMWSMIEDDSQIRRKGRKRRAEDCDRIAGVSVY